MELSVIMIKVENEVAKKGFHCKHCHYQGTHLWSLKRHIETVHAKMKEHVCKKGSSTFTQKASLIKHEKSVHLKLKEHECPVCGSAFCEKN